MLTQNTSDNVLEHPQLRLIAANSKVAALDKAIITHERDTAPMLRILQQLMNSDIIDRDCRIPADDGGKPYTIDDVEDALLTIAMSLTSLSLARRTAVES